METGYSVVTEVPPGYKRDFDYFLFGQAGHLALQGEPWMHVYLLHKKNHKVMAEVAFHPDGDLARSPLRAPFGSFLFSPRILAQTLQEFIVEVERLLTRKGISRVRLTEPPALYRKREGLLQTILLNRGYQIQLAELSSIIRIDRISFEDKIDRGEKGRLRQARKKGLTFRLLKIDKLRLAYQFILACSKERDHSLSMTIEDLQATAAVFRNEFVLSAVYLQEEMVGASVALRVHPQILYNFYSGHLKKYDSLSPIVSLLGGLYGYCEKQQIQLLDLGTSSLKGQLNFSLLNFKLRLGAEPSIKLSFEKELA